ncbi:unnamed protein product [Lactuca virosa]|uniref:PHD-type domain-containing protein n=1 Tax=Lactuca virosa TaxID=75947 RepID=A0AAU9LUH4_9ASTR|nr:unnamed protein product [Lactuca virosa]
MDVEVVDDQLCDIIVCDICGDVGYEHLLAICSRCMDGAEHTYCMQSIKDEVPKNNWLCEDCKFGDVYDITRLTDEDVDTEDTADSIKPLKTARVTIQRRNRFSKLSHLPDDKDYRYGLELHVDVNHPIHGEDDAPHLTEDDVGVIQPNPANNDESEPGED